MQRSLTEIVGMIRHDPNIPLAARLQLNILHRLDIDSTLRSVAHFGRSLNDEITLLIDIDIADAHLMHRAINIPFLYSIQIHVEKNYIVCDLTELSA